MTVRLQTETRRLVEATVAQVRAGQITIEMATARLFKQGIPIAAIKRILSKASPPDRPPADLDLRADTDAREPRPTSRLKKLLQAVWN
jgi:hypothetical protein